MANTLLPFSLKQKGNVGQTQLRAQSSNLQASLNNNNNNNIYYYYYYYGPAARPGTHTVGICRSYSAKESNGFKENIIHPRH